MWQNILTTFSGFFLNLPMIAVAAIITAITAGIAWFWTKHPVRWVLAIVTVLSIALAVWFGPKVPDLDPDLPVAFLKPRFMIWVLVLTLTTLYLSVHLIGVLIQTRRGVDPDGSGEPPRFPDLESAWDEITIRLSHAQYDAGRQKVFLLLPTDESVAAAFIRSAGLQFFAQAPVDENAPIHAYATADGLFMSCAGASAWGRGDDEGNARLVELCRKIFALNPEQPVLRGLAVLYPMERAASADLLQKVGALRNDLQTIRAELNVRCPTFAVFCLHEPYAGFDEFAARIPTNVRVRRCGFSVPLAQPFDHAAAQKGLSWLVQWFYTWSIKLMTDEYHQTAGNSNLVFMNAQLWRDLPALCHLIEVSFSTHARAEPILVRGCYFVACGPEPSSHAFAAGLINGKASKLITDAPYTSWSHGADAIDRRYRLAALGLGLCIAAIVLPIWILDTMVRLKSLQPTGPILGWSCLGALAVIWAGGLLYEWFGRKNVAKSSQET